AEPSDAVAELHAAVRRWTTHIPQNLPYVDLMFAFGFATLGDRPRAAALVEDARRVMVVPIPEAWNDVVRFEATASALITNFLFKAFKYRVDQALAGKPHAGSLPPELHRELAELTTRGRTAGANNPLQRAEYAIGRAREQFRILDPQER